MNATLPSGQRCSGTLSDWDEEICAVRPRLQLTLHRCNRRRVYVQGRCINFNDETSLEGCFNTILVSACDLFPAECIIIFQRRYIRR